MLHTFARCQINWGPTFLGGKNLRDSLEGWNDGMVETSPTVDGSEIGLTTWDGAKTL